MQANSVLTHWQGHPSSDVSLHTESIVPGFAGVGAAGLVGREAHRHGGHHHGSGGAAPGMGAGTGGQYGPQGTDNFGNLQAPQSGAAVYNADGQAVGTGNTSITPGQTVSTSHTGSGSGYSSGNTGRDTGTGPSLASVVPGTQAYKEAHLRDGQQHGHHQRGTGSDYNSGSGIHHMSAMSLALMSRELCVGSAGGYMGCHYHCLMNSWGFLHCKHVLSCWSWISC